MNLTLILSINCFIEKFIYLCCAISNNTNSRIYMIILERIFFYLFGGRSVASFKLSRHRTASYCSQGRKVQVKENSSVRFRSVSWSIYRFLWNAVFNWLKLFVPCSCYGIAGNWFSAFERTRLCVKLDGFACFIVVEYVSIYYCSGVAKVPNIGHFISLNIKRCAMQ